MSTSLGKMSTGARKSEKGFSRYGRLQRFRAAGRECSVCGLITGNAQETKNHENNQHAAEIAARRRRVLEIEQGVGITRATGAAA